MRDVTDILFFFVFCSWFVLFDLTYAELSVRRDDTRRKGLDDGISRYLSIHPTKENITYSTARCGHIIGHRYEFLCGGMRDRHCRG